MDHVSESLPTTLYTDRLVLRFADPKSQNDCNKIVQVINSSGMATVSLDTINDIHTRHRQFAPKSGWCTRAPAPDRLFHLIYLKMGVAKSPAEDQKPIGQIVMNFRPNMPSPDIGYVLLERYRGKGYGTEAAREVLRLWRDEVGVQGIFAAILGANAESVKVAENLGMRAGGGLWIETGSEENAKRMKAVAYVLPGMKWSDVDAEGMEWVLKPAVRLEKKESAE